MVAAFMNGHAQIVEEQDELDNIYNNRIFFSCLSDEYLPKMI